MSFRTQFVRLLNLHGEKLGNGVAGTSDDIIVLERDRNGKITRATGTDVPADTTAGYAKGCLFTDTDVAAGTNGLYVNIGTTASANFDLEGTVSSGSVTADDLATAVTPSHVVKYAGEVTWTGGLTTLASTVTGVAATDIVIASIHTLGTQGTILQGAVASLNTITFTIDTANTSNDTVVSYVVFRAVA